MHCWRLIYVATICVTMIGCNSGKCNLVDDALEQIFDETYERVTRANLKEAAWWFKAHYGQLVRKLDESSYSKISDIIAQHRREYAIRNLRPYLHNDDIEKRILVAAIIYSRSYLLEPDAETILRTAGNDSEVAQSLLNPSPVAASLIDEEARIITGLPTEEWETLSKNEKWKALQKAWSMADDLFERRTSREVRHRQ